MANLIGSIGVALLLAAAFALGRKTLSPASG